MRKILNWLYYKIYGFYLYKGVKYNLNNKKDFERFCSPREKEIEELGHYEVDNIKYEETDSTTRGAELVKIQKDRQNLFKDIGHEKIKDDFSKDDVFGIPVVLGGNDLRYLAKRYPEVKE